MKAEPRLIVDGMNVIGSRPDRWWRDRPAAMRNLTDQLQAYAAETGEPLTVVFDGRAPPDAGRWSSEVRVRFTDYTVRNSADDEIERLVREDRDPDSIRVVTSDVELADRVRAHGAAVVSAGTFRRRLDARTDG
jgi:predicted RNA-binding protein with PIN domain